MSYPGGGEVVTTTYNVQGLPETMSSDHPQTYVSQAELAQQLLLCPPDEPLEADSQEEGRSPKVSWDAARAHWHLLLNQQRAQGAVCGSTYYAPVPALAAEQMLHNAAKRHSEDMALRDFIDHVNPDGATLADRVEAEGYPGPSLIIAYAQCIAHGINMTTGYKEQKKAVQCGHWPLYRFDPRLKEQGKNPLRLDSKAPTLDLEEYIYGENRYRSLKKSNPEAAAKLLRLAKSDAAHKYALMERLANLACEDDA